MVWGNGLCRRDAREWAVTWTVSTDVDAFLGTAGDLLTAAPIDHTVLLTEAAYLSARGLGGVFGWWRRSPGEAVAGAFVQAPRHAPVLSLMPVEGLSTLPAALPGLNTIGVDGRMVAAFGPVTERSRIQLHRLGRLRRPTPPPGRARPATRADRPLLVEWYEQLMAAFPDDPSDLAYVVDDPLDDGGMMLWERDGTPVAMASRSRVVAGMTRVGATHPHGDPHAQAALVAACAAAQEVARDVLMFADGAYARRWGFEPVLERVMLELP
jgi:hypothetical protein